METTISEEDKDRIEKEASWRYTNGHGGTDEYLEEVFIGACIYERTLANQQLAEKDKRIADLEEALRVAENIIRMNNNFNKATFPEL